MIRVIVADDHPVVREGLKRIVARFEGIEVVGEAADGNEAVSLAASLPSDVLLLDISMPGPGFLETLRRLREARPDLAVLVLSVHPEDHYALRSLDAGAAGYLNKDRSPEELEGAIRRVAEGGKFITGSVARQFAARVVGEPARPVHHRLSVREFEVFLLLASGKSVTQIATELDLSPKTVSTYRTRILEKTKLANNAQIIRFALEQQLLGNSA